MFFNLKSQKLFLVILAGLTMIASSSLIGSGSVLASGEVWLDGTGVSVEVDDRSAIAVYQYDGTTKTGLTTPAAQTALTGYVFIGGVKVSDFTRTSYNLENNVTTTLGQGKRLTVIARSPSKLLQRTIILEVADTHPGVVFMVTKYKAESSNITLDNFYENDFTLTPVNPPPSGTRLWSYQGGLISPDYVAWGMWGEDDACSIADGFSRQNIFSTFGGVPLVDIYSRGGGILVGSAAPKMIDGFSIPVTGASGTATLQIKGGSGLTLQSGVDTEVFTSMIVAHKGDYYQGMKAYRLAMVDRGNPMPVYEPNTTIPRWETWGYTDTWMPSDIIAKLPELKTMGVNAITIDLGWYQKLGKTYLTGDNPPDSTKFPNGDSDVRALVDAIHAQGFKVILWWRPECCDKTAPMATEHEDYIIHDASGANVTAPFGEGSTTDWALCPAYQPVIDHEKAFIQRALVTYDCDGLKMDWVYACPPCFNTAHGHASPMDACKAFGDLWNVIYTTARSYKPHAFLELCNCGCSQNFYTMPYLNAPITSDPIGSLQSRYRLKYLKAMYGSTFPIQFDHMELTNIINWQERTRGPIDWASMLGNGGCFVTKYSNFKTVPQADYNTWCQRYNTYQLSTGDYMGELYNYGFDNPEACAIKKGTDMYYGFYMNTKVAYPVNYTGPIELRGLAAGTLYQVTDYINNVSYGVVTGPTGTLDVNFDNNLLLKATPTTPGPPGSFNLLTPTNGATNVARTSTAFDWQNSDQASTYTIVVSVNSDFSSPIINVSGLTSSNYTSTVQLGSKTKYYWKVTAINAYGSTQCTTTFSFTTKH